MAVNQEAWLNSVTEEVIEPEIPICDAQISFSDDQRENVINLAQISRKEQLENIYDKQKFMKDISGGHNVLKTVYVEYSQRRRTDGPEELRPVGETEYVRSVAGEYPTSYGTIELAAGMVAQADLGLGDAVKPVLEAHLEAGGKMVRGVRFRCVWDADTKIKSYSPPFIMYDQKFREGFACLKKYDLSFDAFLYFKQLPDLIDLARAFPDIPVIVNHIGGTLGVGSYAGRREEFFPIWKKWVAELATFPNVYIKLGGEGNIRCGYDWHLRPIPPSSQELASAWSPYFNWCIENFGSRRCMFESNFPADRKSCSYTVIWNAFKRIAKRYSEEDKRSLFYRTAVEAYGLE